MSFESDVLAVLKKSGIKEAKMEVPPNSGLGDLAFACFELARIQKRSPVDIAKELAAKFKPKGLISKIQATGPYVNFFIDFDALAKTTIAQAQRSNFGAGQRKKEKLMVEYSQPNTHKAFHVGHVRSTSIGQSIIRVLELAGYKVIKANYMGDTGAHVAKCLWAYQKFHKGETPKQERGAWLGKVYAEANQVLKERPEYDEEVKDVLLRLEKSRDKKLNSLWTRTRQWSLDDFKKIYKELDAKFDCYFFESQMERPAKRIARKMLKQKIAKMSDGAIIVDLEKYGLGIFVLLRKDGTALYSAKDLALAEVKFKKYKIDRSIYVVANEQTMHFRQVFKTLELLGFKKVKNCVHVPFELVVGPAGKMSTREGTGINYTDLKNDMLASVLPKVKDKHPKLSKKEQEKAAMQVVVGAIKYPMLKVNNSKVVVFDWAQALSLEGDTAPYIQYTYVRARNILKTVGRPKKGQLAFSTSEEKALIKLIAQLPELVAKVSETTEVHTIAKYAYDLASSFNLFYEKYPILRETDKKVKNSRLNLVAAYASTIKKALYLLGIEAPELM